jgi:hypothetical protein
MAGPSNQVNKHLKVERICERSRLEEHLVASAYELVTPILRRRLPDAVPDHNQRLKTARSQRKTGGNEA